MKALLIGLLAAGAVPFMTGCATPGYSGGMPTARIPAQRATGENANRILRNLWIENMQLAEDINSVLLLDPPSRLSIWNLR
jgi:uncharacterized lipoprotein YmbA